MYPEIKPPITDTVSPIAVMAMSLVSGIPPCAAAAPAIAAIMACDSLVGIPNNHALIASIITDNSAAHIPLLSVPAASKIFFATAGNSRTLITVPKKLHSVASITAFFILRAPEHTHPVIAFGASVNPFTNITPSVKIVDITA